MDAVGFAIAALLSDNEGIPSVNESRAALPATTSAGSGATLDDGRVFVEFNGVQYIYDNVANTYTSIATRSQGASSAGNRANSIAIANNKVLMINSDYASVYDVASNTWALQVSTPTQYSYMVADRLLSGLIIVTGYSSSAPHATQKYDPIANVWTALAAAPNSHGNGASSILKNGDVCFTGGGWGSGQSQFRGWVSVYNEASNTWTDHGQKIGSRGYHVQMTLPDGRILAGSGVTSAGADYTGATIYDFDTGATDSSAPTMLGWARSLYAQLKDGTLFYGGGENYGEWTLQSATRRYIPAVVWKSKVKPMLLGYLASK